MKVPFHRALRAVRLCIGAVVQAVAGDASHVDSMKHLALYPALQSRLYNSNSDGRDQPVIAASTCVQACVQCMHCMCACTVRSSACICTASLHQQYTVCACIACCSACTHPLHRLTSCQSAHKSLHWRACDVNAREQCADKL